MRLIVYSSAIAATVFMCSVNASNKYIKQTHLQNTGDGVHGRDVVYDIAQGTTSKSEVQGSQVGKLSDSDTESATDTEDDPEFVGVREQILADLEEKFRQETKPKRNTDKERSIKLTEEEFRRLYQYIKNLDPNDAEETRAPRIREAVGVDSKRKVRYVRDMFMKPREVHYYDSK